MSELTKNISDKPLKIAMVGYLNTVPMVYGLTKSQQDYDLHLEIPSKCYELYEHTDIDVALLPVGVLPLLSDARVVTDFCIGCKSTVRTVCLFSNSPIENIKTLYLDKDSRTSVLLTRILIKEHWQTEVNYIDRDIRSMDLSKLASDEAVLMIGDKVFEVEKEFNYKYDLGEEWFKYSSKPFAFAVWVAKSHVSKGQIDQLEKDLGYGIDHTAESLLTHQSEERAFDLTEYFRDHIDYSLDVGKKDSMRLYLSKIEDLIKVSSI